MKRRKLSRVHSIVTAVSTIALLGFVVGLAQAAEPPVISESGKLRTAKGTVFRRFFALALAVVIIALVPALAGAQTEADKACILAMNKAGAKVASSQGKLTSGCIAAAASGKLLGACSSGTVGEDCVTDAHCHTYRCTTGTLGVGCSTNSDCDTGTCISSGTYGAACATNSDCDSEPGAEDGWCVPNYDGVCTSEDNGVCVGYQTAEECIAEDAKGKVAGAQQKMVDAEIAKCAASPPFGFAPAGQSKYVVADEEVSLARRIFSELPTDAALTDKTAAKCHGTLAKTYERLAAARLKDFVSCKSAGFAADTITGESGLIACMGSAVDFSGKVARTRDKIQSVIEAKCAGHLIPGCFGASSSEFATCVTRAVECHMCWAINAMDNLSSPCDALDDGNVNGSCRQCGNPLVESPEQCDDAGETAFCDADCTFAACGDGYVNSAAGELCDDGNRLAGDGCGPDCDRCGDGAQQLGEECDDGNRNDGDGCDEHCRLQGVSCPTSMELTMLAGTGDSCVTNDDCVDGSTCDTVLGRCKTATELDSGFSGNGHDYDVNDKVVIERDLVCPGPGPLCGQCAVVGVIPKDDNCRCKSDSRVICDEPFRSDEDDCGGELCTCYLGPPLPVYGNLNGAVCLVTQFTQNISGTVNVDTGAGQIDNRFKIFVYSAEERLRPCPVCGGTCTAPPTEVGRGCAQSLDCDTFNGAADGVCGNFDPMPNDGVRAGKCFGGANNGEACDAQAVNTTFPAPQGGSYSLDCMPASVWNQTGTGLNVALAQTTGAVALPPAALPCGFDGLDLCACGECSADRRTGCTSNADCAGIGTCTAFSGLCSSDGLTRCTSNADCPGTGICGIDFHARNPKPNDCDDGRCFDLGGGEGECSNDATPDRFCDGILRANGEGFIACGKDADCAGAGYCALTKRRECFPNPVTATGIQNADTPLEVAVFCMPRTNDVYINVIGGLPGPARLIAQQKSKLFCANNPTNLYAPGVGCP